MLLSGADLSGYIKERQAKTVRSLKQVYNLTPRLAILQANDDPAINAYVKGKKRYGEDIGAGVEIVRLAHNGLLNKVNYFNSEKGTHGIIVQLPVPDEPEIEKILNSVSPTKDVDGLNKKSDFESASATAILWLLAGYNIELNGKNIVVVGQGRLIGGPLSDVLERSGYNVVRCDSNTKDLVHKVKQADVLISATGTPRLIKSDWIKSSAVVIDAGTASEQGEIIGDLDDEVYGRGDLKVTPKKGGVGPLTVCSLFENLIRASQEMAKSRSKK